MTRAQRSLLGVLGWPLEYTLSPEIHGAAFRAAGLDWVYLAWPVAPESLGEAVAGLKALGAIGANVTMPHKEKVIEFVDELGEDARAVGAVNTLQFGVGGVIGHNTDIEGFSEFLSGDAGFSAAGASALVLGGGGAARAVVRAVDSLGASRVTVASRDGSIAAEVASLAATGATVPWDERASLATEADLIVNCTPLGAGGEDPAPEARFHPGQTVVDLTYQPASTPLLERARLAGASSWGGLGMLVRQAAGSFRIWTGQPAPLETMSAAAIRTVGLHSHPSSG